MIGYLMDKYAYTLDHIYVVDSYGYVIRLPGMPEEERTMSALAMVERAVSAAESGRLL